MFSLLAFDLCIYIVTMDITHYNGLKPYYTDIQRIVKGKGDCMKFEKDFRLDLKKLEAEAKKQEGKLGASEVEHITADLRQIRETYQAQFTKVYSEGRVNKVTAAYRKLTDIALVNSGYVSLMINEEEKTAVISYQGTYLFVSNIEEEESDGAASILCEILTSFRIISLSAQAGEIVIEARMNLYDEWKTDDKSKELKRLENNLKKRF